MWLGITLVSFATYLGALFALIWRGSDRNGHWKPQAKAG